MKYVRMAALTVLLTFATSFVYSDFSRASSSSLISELSTAIGFVLAQRLSLEYVKDKYPSLLPRAELADYKFNENFSSAEENMRNALKNIAGDRYNEVSSSLENTTASTLSALSEQEISFQVAENYLAEIEARAEGNIPSPILETLLTYQFEDRPAEEYIRGFRTTYRTAGHPKAKGLDFQIEIPQSWDSKEGRRPNIIQLFTNKNGRGFVNVSIMVRDIAEEAGEELTHEDLEFLESWEGSEFLVSEMFANSNLEEMAKSMAGFDNIRNLQSQRIVLDSWPGALVSFVGDGRQLDLTLTMYNELYYVMHKRYLILLTCQAAKLPDNTDNEFRDKISNVLPLFRLIASSLVIRSQY